MAMVNSIKISAGAQSIAVSVATANGLGVSIDQLTSSELSAQLKVRLCWKFRSMLTTKRLAMQQISCLS